MTEIALLDTHALLWWVGGHATRLGRAARRFVEDVDQGRAVACVSATAAMAVRAHDLYAIPERGDRLIAATALELGYPLVTRDPEIVAAIGGEQLW